VLAGLFAAAAAAFAAGLYALVVEPLWRLRVQRWSLSPAGWPSGQRLRIVMVADLHACEPWMPPARVARIVARAQALQGDLIVLMGDYRASHRFQRGRVAVETVAPILAQLTAPLGVFAINGNHDWWDDRAAQARLSGPIRTEAAMLSAGIPVLVNRAIRIEAGGVPFWLAGLDSQQAIHAQAYSGAAGRDDLAGTLAQVTDDAPVILLAHEPDVFPDVPPRVSVTLSGHTHGGQIRFGAWVPAVPSRFGARYAWGLIVEEGRTLVVSGGLGCSGLPLRFGMPPEITVVELGGPGASAKG
jgi:predicted MPP superfamily phosphohydrolase